MATSQRRWKPLQKRRHKETKRSTNGIEKDVMAPKSTQMTQQLNTQPNDKAERHLRLKTKTDTAHRTYVRAEAKKDSLEA
jgi:hypothetical protein